MAVALVERTQTDAELEALAAFVRLAADHPQIQVETGGVLSEERDGHRAGTPYLTVTVPTVDAAELAEQRLRELARIDLAAWRSGWRLVDGPALELDIYPHADEARAFVALELAAEARRRPDLEAYVREQLSAAPDVAITDSGSDEDERGFVEIRVSSADGADRAERALAGVAELVLPWRLTASVLVTRVYL